MDVETFLKVMMWVAGIGGTVFTVAWAIIKKLDKSKEKLEEIKSKYTSGQISSMHEDVKMVRSESKKQFGAIAFKLEQFRTDMSTLRADIKDVRYQVDKLDLMREMSESSMKEMKETLKSVINEVNENKNLFHELAKEIERTELHRLGKDTIMVKGKKRNG